MTFKVASAIRGGRWIQRTRSSLTPVQPSQPNNVDTSRPRIHLSLIGYDSVKKYVPGPHVDHQVSHSSFLSSFKNVVLGLAWLFLRGIGVRFFRADGDVLRKVVGCLAPCQPWRLGYAVFEHRHVLNSLRVFHCRHARV